jgi:hypothetical protein
MVEYSEYRTPDIYNEYMDRFYYNFNNNNDFDLKDEIVRDDDIDYNFYYFI